MERSASWPAEPFEACFEWFCDDPTTLDLRGVALELVDSCNFLDAPGEVLELLPAELHAMLPTLADDPQMTSYRQNLAIIRAT